MTDPRESHLSTRTRKPNPISRARQLRRDHTWAERLVWRWLRDRRFSSYKFRRQHPFGPYILDFFCFEARLGIELDGSGHGHPGQQQRDTIRDAYFQTHGIQVLRIWNHRLRLERAEVREMIFRWLMERAPHPAPRYWQPGVQGGEGRESEASEGELSRSVQKRESEGHGERGGR
jgi:very-short-patch-repair endonuclease